MRKLLFLLTLILTFGLLLTGCVDGSGGDDDGGNNPPPVDNTPEVDGEWDPTDISVLSVKNGCRGIVVLIHDDGTWDTAVTLDSLYHEYGLVGDAALLSSRVWNASTETVNTAELAKWSALLETDRWKIVSHSATHTWWGTTTQNDDGSYTFVENDDKMYYEIVGSQEVLRTLFPGQRVLTFAYPGFTTEKNYVGNTAEKIFEVIYSEKARDLLEETYISCRAGLGLELSVTSPTLHWARKYKGKVYASETAWNYFPAFGFGDSFVESGKISKIINNCLAQQMAVLYMHKVVDTLTGGSNEMTTANMRALCQELSAKVESGEIWNAHYEDAVMYVREATSAIVKLSGDESGFTITLTDGMDDEIYNYPITVRSRAPKEWEAVKVTQGDTVSYAVVRVVDNRYAFDVDLVPDGGVATVEPIALADIPATEAVTPSAPVSKNP